MVIMQLVERGSLKLNDTLTKILGFEVTNPYYPDVPITVEMVLCHMSSIAETSAQYISFMEATQNNTDGGLSIPTLKDILLPGGKYYNSNIYSPNRKPGEYFSYSNLGYAIAGTIIEIISQTRFDIYVQKNLLDPISKGFFGTASFNPATINFREFGWIFEGKNGLWMPSKDNYTRAIVQKNLTSYQIGTNGAIYGPASQMRASTKHLNHITYILANKGVTRWNQPILSQSSINEMIKPRYQYHGPSSGNPNFFHLYGLGVYTTSYLNDAVIDHEVVRGHLGNCDGMISGTFYWSNWSFSYIINGALNGYGPKNNSIYETERVMIHQAVNDYIVAQTPNSTEKLVQI